MVGLDQIEGVSEAHTRTLVEEGYDTDQVAKSDPYEIADVLDIRPSAAADILAEVREAAEREFGFTTGNDVDDSSPFADVDVQEDVYGWELFVQQRARVGWRSPGGYELVAEGPTNRVFGKLPDEDRSDPNSRTTRAILQKRLPSPDAAVEWAEEWMVKRAIDPDTDLADYHGIGGSTADYLQIVYAVNSGADLYQFLLEDRETLQEVVGSQFFDDLETELEAEFGAG